MGGGNTPSNPKCDHPNPNTNPIPMNIGIAANNPNPAPKSRRWADVARWWKHNPSPAVFPRPNPPRVGKGKATGFLRRRVRGIAGVRLGRT